MMEEWHKRLALRIVADLPESEEDARLVLQAAGSSLLVVRQVRTDAVDHHQDESAIIHIEPIRTADEFIFAVPNEWTVKIGREIRLVETCHGQRQPGDPEPAWSREACDTTQPHRIVASLVD